MSRLTTMLFFRLFFRLVFSFPGSESGSQVPGTCPSLAGRRVLYVWSIGCSRDSPVVGQEQARARRKQTCFELLSPRTPHSLSRGHAASSLRHGTLHDLTFINLHLRTGPSASASASASQRKYATHHPALLHRSIASQRNAITKRHGRRARTTDFDDDRALPRGFSERIAMG